MGRLEDRQVGRLEDRLEDRQVGPWEDRLEGPLLVHSTVRQVLAPVVLHLPVRLVHQPTLGGVAQESRYRQRRRLTCRQVGTVLPHRGLFLLRFFVWPWWHPFHPHGAA